MLSSLYYNKSGIAITIKKYSKNNDETNEHDKYTNDDKDRYNNNKNRDNIDHDNTYNNTYHYQQYFFCSYD